MKVLHVIPSIAPRYGGPSQAVFEICANLQAVGVSLLIATTNADGPTVLSVPLGTVVDYQQNQVIFFQRDFSEAFKYSRGLAIWLRQNVAQFDLVHIHAVFSHVCLAAAQACRQHRVPYLVRTIGNLDPWGLRQKRWRKKLFWHLGAKQMLYGAAAIHYTAQAEQQLAESALGLERGVVIPLGVDEQLLQPAPGENSFLNQHTMLQGTHFVLTLCRLHPVKNLEALLAIFLRLTEQPALRAWKLVIAGEGEADYVSKLQSLVNTACGTPRVLFTGWLQGETKRGALRAASLFALPSYQENFGLSVVEAMACGVPVLISEAVNLADEVKSARAGWVVSLEHQHIEAALQTALTEADERAARGQAARELVRQRYRWAAVGEQLARLYAEICQQRL